MLFLCALIILCPLVFSQPENKRFSDEFRQSYRQMASEGLAIEASQAESRIMDRLAGSARALGLACEAYPVSDAHSFHSFSNSLRIVLPGTGKKRVSLIMPIGCPQPAGTADAGDPWFNPALAQVLLRRLAAADRPYTIVCEFLGAENCLDSEGLGSRRLAQEPNMKERIFSLYLDLDRNCTDLRVPQGSGGRLTPGWLLDLTLTRLENAGLSASARTVASQLHRLGIGVPNHLGPYLHAGLPAIEITSQNGSAALPGETGNARLVEAVCGLLTTEVPAEVNDGLASWDENYLVFQLGTRHVVVAERSIVLVYLSGLVLLLVVVYFHRSRRHRYLNGFFRHLGTWVVLGLSVALSLLLSGLSAGVFFPRHEELPAYLAMLPWLLLARLILAGGLLMAASRWLRRITTRSAAFYGSAGFITSLLLLVGISLFNLTLSIYMLGATVCVSLANLSRRRWLKALFTLGSAVFPLVPLFEALIQAPGPLVDQYLLKDPWFSTMILGLAVFPFLALVCRQWKIWPWQSRRYRWLRRGFGLSLGLAGVGICVWASLALSGPRGAQTRIEVTRMVSGSRGQDLLLLESAAPIPAGILDLPGTRLPVTGGTGQVQLAVSHGGGAELRTDLKIRKFLGRKVIRLMVDSAAGLQSLSANFAAGSPMVVHSLNFPYQFLDSSDIVIHIGRNPVLPLSLEMTIPADLSGTLVIESTHLGTLTFWPTTGSRRELPCQTKAQVPILIP
jgi:hypothetical protein